MVCPLIYTTWICAFIIILFFEKGYSPPGLKSSSDYRSEEDFFFWIGCPMTVFCSLPPGSPPYFILMLVVLADIRERIRDRVDFWSGTVWLFLCFLLVFIIMHKYFQLRSHFVLITESRIIPKKPHTEKFQQERRLFQFEFFLSLSYI